MADNKPTPAAEVAPAVDADAANAEGAAPVAAPDLATLLNAAATAVNEAQAVATYNAQRAEALAAFNAKWDADRPATPATDLIAANREALAPLAQVLGLASPQVKPAPAGRGSSMDEAHAREWLVAYKASGEPMTNKYSVLGRYRDDGNTATTDTFLALLAEVKAA